MFKALDNQKHEAQDQENHEHNIIIYRSKESKAKNTKERRLHDQHFVDELLSNALDLDIETTDITRLGKPDDEKNRPLRVSFKPRKMQELSTNLQGNFEMSQKLTSRTSRFLTT